MCAVPQDRIASSSASAPNSAISTIGCCPRSSRHPNIRIFVPQSCMEMSQSFSNIIDENSNDKYKGLSEIGFGSQENNSFGNDAFDPRWDDQGKGTVGEVGEGSRGSRTWDCGLCQIILYGTFDKGEYNLRQFSKSCPCVHIMRLAHVLQSPAIRQSANIPMTRRCSRAQEDISSHSSKTFVPKTASAHFDIAKANGEHCRQSLANGRALGFFNLFFAIQVGSVGCFNYILAKVRPEISLRSAVNRISLGMA